MTTYNVSHARAPKRTSGSTSATPTASNAGIPGFGSKPSPSADMAPKVKGWSKESQGN